ncbi:hypothetical protein GCM10008968_14980 [Bacillus horti]
MEVNYKSTVYQFMIYSYIYPIEWYVLLRVSARLKWRGDEVYVEKVKQKNNPPFVYANVGFAVWRLVYVSVLWSGKANSGYGDRARADRTTRALYGSKEGFFNRWF